MKYEEYMYKGWFIFLFLNFLHQLLPYKYSFRLEGEEKIINAVPANDLQYVVILSFILRNILMIDLFSLIYNSGLMNEFNYTL